VPVETPPTVPEELPIVATAALLLIQLPPEVPSVRVKLPPVQTDDPPEIEAGKGLTVTVAVLAQPPLTV